MNRSTAKSLGLILLIPFGTIALLQVLARYSDLLNNTSDFTIRIGAFTLIALTHTGAGAAVVNAWVGAWVLAILGELLLISVSVFAPVRKSRHIITWR